jgi:hypothetical protein
METPTKLSANEILKKHGPAGWLVRKLQFYGMLGWILFFVTLGMFFLTTLVRSLAPQPVIAVDEAGRVLGVMEFLNPSSRSDEELKAASMRFAQLYLSLNSETVFEDYSAAMNMMSPELLKRTQDALKTDNYLARVLQAKSRSWLEFAQPDGAKVVERHNLNAQVRLHGNIVVDGTGGRVSQPFDMTLETQAVARNTNNTTGINILSRKDN